MPQHIIPNPVDALQMLPKKAIGAIVAAASFATIGALTTFKFCVNLLADGLAYSTNAHREKEWAPVIIATLLVAYSTYYVLTHLLLEQAAQKQIHTSMSDEQAFSSGTEFTENLRRARRSLFKQPQRVVVSPSSPPSSRAPTRSPSPANADPLDTLLNETLNEIGTQNAKR